MMSVSSSTGTADDAGAGVGNGNGRKKRGLSQHDLLNKYFRRDAVVLRNVDLLRYV
jgi:phosphatidylethanolamine N-methyltransferase